VGVYFADAGFAGFGGNEHDDTDVILRGDGFVTLFVIAEREVGNDDAIDAAFHALLAEGFEAELHDGIEEITQFCIYHCGIRAFYHLSVLELGEIIYDKPSDNVASFLLMVNGHSNFMSAIL
jgi:hypothetical protein